MKKVAWRSYLRRLVLFMAGFLLVGVVIVAVRGLYVFVAPATAAERKDFIQTVAQIAGGAGLIVTALLGWRTLRLNREGQVTDRFTKAIAQLGDERLAVRLGGIYALERIAWDSPRDHWPVMEVLTAYVRENAPWHETLSRPLQQGLFARPQPDIQAVLTVLGRRSRTVGREDSQRLDLRHTDLRGVRLDGAHLEGADFVGAHLDGAALSGAYLHHARCDNASLRGAILTGAHLEGAMLLATTLDGAWLTGAHLQGANFQGASLRRTLLNGTDMRGAKSLPSDNVREARWDQRTRFPSYLDPLQLPEHSSLLPSNRPPNPTPAQGHAQG